MSRGRRTILIVDDDDDFSDALATFLASRGYETLRAPNGREGVTLARRARPDLILMDVMMTERTEGFFAVQQIRRDPSLARVPVFVVSSIYADVPGFRIRPEHGWLGHDAFFPKPVDMDALVRAIEERLGDPAGGTGRDGSGSQTGPGAGSGSEEP